MKEITLKTSPEITYTVIPKFAKTYVRQLVGCSPNPVWFKGFLNELDMPNEVPGYCMFMGKKEFDNISCVESTCSNLIEVLEYIHTCVERAEKGMRGSTMLAAIKNISFE